MKKYLLIIFIISAFLLITPAYAETGVNLLTFGSGPAAVGEQIGAPIQQSSRDGLLIYWYGSADPAMADFVYFQNEALVMKSISVVAGSQSLDQYVRKYGEATFAVKKYEEGVDDPLDTVMHVWLAHGVMLQTNGRDTVSPVVRVFSFTPTDEEHFFASLAPDLSGNTKLSSQVVDSPLPVASALPAHALIEQAKQLYYTQTPFLVVAVVLFVFMFLLIAYRGR